MNTPKPFTVIAVPDSLEHKYQGSGYAIAAVSPDQTKLIDFCYVRDLDPDFEGEATTPAIAARAIQNNERIKETALFFEEPGFSTFAFGMLSGREFTLL